MRIIKPHGKSDLLHRLVSKIKLLRSLLHLHLDEIINRRIAGFLLEQIGEAGSRIIVQGAELIQANVFIQPVLHIEDGAVNTVNFILFYHKMPRVINKQRQEMHQTHISENQVINTIPKLQRFIDPGEARKDLIAALNIERFEMCLCRMK